MPSHTSLPPPSAGNGPQSRSPADAFGAAGSAPSVKNEPCGSADPAPVSGGTLADRAVEAVFGGEDDARKIEQGATAAGVANVNSYAANIEATLEDANDQMLGTISTQSAAVNMNPTLDGFITEQHHADTFNLDAAGKGSPLRFEVPGSQSKNSVGIVMMQALQPVP